MPVTQLPIVCDGLESGITIVKNTAKTITASVSQDLTNAVIQLEVKRTATSLDALLTKLGTVVPPGTDGKFVLELTADDTANITTGFYHFNITAESSTLPKTVLSAGRFVVEPFDQVFVGGIDPIITTNVTGATERFFLMVKDRNGVLQDPDVIGFQVFDYGDSIILNDPSGAGLSHPQVGMYTYDFTSNRVGDFLVIWSYQIAGEEPQKIIQNVRFVSPQMIRMVNSVRLYIDKARKASNRTIAFNLQDVAEYIENSIRDFNSAPPMTGVTIDNIPEEFKETIILGAIIQSLIAQGLLAVDQDFQYSDNGITLAVDHSTKLQSWFQQLVQIYAQKKKTNKMSLFAPTVYARSNIGQAYTLGASKVPPGTLSRFRGWI